MTQPENPLGESGPFPPPMPDNPAGQEPFYQDSRPYGSAPALLKVAAIMNTAMGGIDILWCLVLVMLLILLATGTMPKEIIGPGGPMNNVPMSAFEIELGVYAPLSVIAGVVKLIAGIKLLRKTRAAWGFGLTGGIIGCLQIWCSLFCILPMGIGIFTIVVMSLGNTRRYLRDSAAGARPPADGTV